MPPEGGVYGFVQSPTGGVLKTTAVSQVRLRATPPTPIKLAASGGHGILGLGGAGARLRLRQAPE